MQIGSRWTGLTPPGADLKPPASTPPVPQDAYVPAAAEEKRFPWGRAALAGLGLVGGSLAVRHFMVTTEDLHFPKQVPVMISKDKAVQLPAARLFDKFRDLRDAEVEMKVRVPATWEEKHVAVIAVQARDAGLRTQSTRWTEGQLTKDNPNYDPASHTLTLHYRPSTAEVNEQGRTDVGFDPTHVMSLRLVVKNESGQPAPGGAPVTILDVVESKLISSLPLQEAAEVRPLLRVGPPQGHPPQAPAQPLAGVSRFFAYGDLQRWSEVRGRVDETLAAQNAADLHAFRFMGGLDLRHQQGKAQLDPAVYPAMRDFLDLCRTHHQDHLIFTLVDGAIPNPTLQKALTDSSARKEMIEALRPFVRDFGNARVNGQPVVFDLVNEIHGTPGTEASKQQLVHDMIDMFIQEAPGARLTVGVQNFRELSYWTHLLERYQGKPVEFLMTFHLYENVDNLPPAGQLNIPANVEIGITEADPTKDMKEITHKAAEKGYDWMLFWTDSKLPYQPGQHRQLLH